MDSNDKKVVEKLSKAEQRRRAKLAARRVLVGYYNLGLGCYHDNMLVAPSGGLADVPAINFAGEVLSSEFRAFYKAHVSDDAIRSHLNEHRGLEVRALGFLDAATGKITPIDPRALFRTDDIFKEVDNV